MYDFGGRGADLILVHATGFCAEVFVPLARGLGHRFHCWGLDLRAHGRSDRPADGDFAWSGFCTDVLTAIDHLGLSRPIGFGHSCGGAAILLAEQARPGTFASLYCFEPVVFDLPDVGLAVGNPMSGGGPAAARDVPLCGGRLCQLLLQAPVRGPGSRSPPVLRRIRIRGGAVRPGGDGRSIRLRCRRDDEAAIYERGADHGAFGHLREITCHVTLCCGERTDAFGLRYLQADADQLPRSTVEVVPGVGHFGPLEQPGLLATSVERAGVADGGTPGS